MRHQALVLVAVLLWRVAGTNAAGIGGDFPRGSDAAPPVGSVGDAMAPGQRVVTHAPQNAAKYSANALDCTSCHMNAGRTP